MKRIGANFVLIASACALFSLGAQAMPMLYYHVRPCTPGVDCNVSAHATAPNSASPDNADFQKWYGANLGKDLSGDVFTWSAASNGQGYWFGSVADSASGIHGSYLWLGDHFLCCALNGSYFIADGNDRNHFVGYDPNGVSNLGEPLFPAFVGGIGGAMGLPPFEYGILKESLEFLGSGRSTVRFVAIDDGDRILATWCHGWLEFDTVDYRPPPLPEVPSGWLVLPLTLGLLRYRMRRGALSS